MSDHKIVMLGSGGVGKSALTIQFIQGSFIERYDPTIEDSYRKHIELDGKVRILDILDTAGQEEYNALRDTYMRNGDGFVFVISLTDPSSLVDVLEMHEQLLRSKDTDDIPVVLVGNKCDLVEERTISQEECNAAVKQMGPYCRYVEASAKNRIGIERIFETLLKTMDGFNEDEKNREDDYEDENDKETTNKVVKKKKKVCSIM